ncbi:MAG: HD domain-containing phosphohydrolase, partial [Thermodesulfobacteriota bacterium]
MEKKARILIVDDDASTRRILSLILDEKGYETETAGTGREAIEKVKERFYNLALLDIRLPDMEGIELLAPLKKIHPEMEMIMVTGYASAETAVRALNEGASAYVTKPLNMEEVLPPVREVLEKQRLAVELRNLILVDGLTGLNNRRGFMILVQQQLKLANRTKMGLLLLFADVDNLKWTNDVLGHNKGDQALIATANILKQTFREPDIIARIGGDEFAVLAIESRKQSAEILMSRLQEKLDAHNAKGRRSYKLSLSVGIAYYDPKCPCSIDELLERADRSMYEQKRKALAPAREASFEQGSVREKRGAREELKQSVEQIQRTVGGTIRALASAVEMRDPYTAVRDSYTAGHIRKVAELASAIAKEMDLSEEQVEGIHVAGTLHDIGKVYVPVEILNKPGRLTEMEMGLIKAHSQVGPEILKEIDFPWPVAQIVRQHHERMDGSGYPQGITGEDILLEARILAVADVVEAMASHRPYRPAHGMKKALEEIAQNKSILYDPVVVDA